jgi:MYXO-CTERM domain-containing protein
MGAIMRARSWVVVSSVFALVGVPRAARAEDGGGGSCTPNTCATYGYNCGPNGDGCGGMLDCGVCTPPMACGAGGFSICGDPLAPADGAVVCIPQTCMMLGFSCGASSDGCGAIMNCGECAPPAYCGGGGPNHCGGDAGSAPDASARDDAGSAPDASARGDASSAGAVDASSIDASDAETASLDATLGDSEPQDGDTGIPATASGGGCSCSVPSESTADGLAGIAWVLAPAALAWRRRPRQR